MFLFLQWYNKTMAHERKRHAENSVQRLLAFSSIVGVFGHRQVGKTTLISHLCSEYITLDLRAQLARIEEDPSKFLDSTIHFPLAIDEAQNAPTLFPALKEYVRLHKQPGQFLLSGSVRFTSRKAIRESLTGRIVHIELLPFTQSEMDGRPINQAIFYALAKNWHDLGSLKVSRDKDIVLSYLRTGGLPGVCFIRSNFLRSQRLESQLETVLERDLRLIFETRLPFSTLRNVLVNLAILQGSPLDLQNLSRKTRVSVPTLRKLLSAFESAFLIRTVLTEGTEKHPVIFFEDQGEATHLMNRPLDPLTEMTRFLLAQIRPPLAYQSKHHTDIFQYRTRGGAFVPIAIRSNYKVLGLIPMLEENPARQAMGSAVSFLKNYPKSCVVFVHPGKKTHRISSDMISLPISVFA